MSSSASVDRSDSLVVVDLHKIYPGGHTALKGVSFVASPGGLTGFLGVNGAGKTTTLRIVSGYLQPTSGTAYLCGVDVSKDSLSARRLLGYLPEHVPLYEDLRVGEYLRYRAELRGLARKRRILLAEAALDKVGLKEEGERLISQLSRGMRQRVGLADVLLHEPPILILDEPLEGLDPNQRKEILDLLTELAKERVVLLSTHVLPEVEHLCKEVIILDRGQVVLKGAPADLTHGLGSKTELWVVCRGDREVVLGALAQIPGVSQVEEKPPQAKDQHHLLVRLKEPALPTHSEAIARAILMTAKGELSVLRPVASDLQTVFQFMTKGAP